MSLQYIHTSARRGLEPGKSGFCCVARDQDLPLDLSKELEKLSRYEHIAGRTSPVILRHLRLSIRSGTYHVLSRISDAGADYSKRNNHLAHHLAFSEPEIAGLPDPATLLLFWKNWRESWTEPPRILTDRDQFKIQELNTTSDSPASRFESPIKNGNPVDAAFTIEEGVEIELALHFRNELLTLPAETRWSVPFTNFILTSDQPNQFLWRGNWEGRSLPFEFETQNERVTSSSSPEIAHEPQPTETPEPAPETNAERITKVAPKVEIPEELTAAHRKRPKRKWTRKRLTRTLNLTLAVLGVLCCGTIIFLLLDFKEPEGSPEIPLESLPLQTGSQAPRSSDSEDPSPRDAWSSLAESNRLYEEIERAQSLAQQLAILGDEYPQTVSNTLLAIQTTLGDKRPESPHLLALPSELVQRAANQWVLDSTLASEISDLGLALVPSALTPLLKEPFPSDPIFEPLVEILHWDRFIAEDAILTLKAVKRAARDRLVKSGIDAVTAAEDYRNQWLSLADDPIAESIHKLETAFKMDPHQGYLAVDSDGLLVNPQQTSISTHIRNLYERFLLPRVTSFETSPEFRNAMQKASQRQDTVIEDARAIFQALSAAKPLSQTLESDLDQIRDQWKETFIREDLMQETIINFNLERLANRKGNLAALQSHFTPETFAEIDSANQIIDLASNAEAAILAINNESNWALFFRNSQN